MSTAGLSERAAELDARGLHKLALPLHIAAAREAPDAVDAWVHAGSAALKLGEPALAARLLEECVGRHPSSRRATSKLMVARLRLSDFAGADALCARVLELEPDNVQALVTRGYLAPVLGSAAAAQGWFEAAFRIEARDGIHRSDGFVARLLVGDYRTGWGCLHPDSHVRVPERWVRRLDPVWRGEPLAEGTVCVHSFGGLGDVILLVRYVPRIARRVARVVVTAPASLDPVLRGVPGLAGVVRAWSDEPGAHFVGALQLPAIFGTTADSVPCTFPYLHAPPGEPVLPPRRRLRVGLAWAGNPRLWTDPDRSVPAVELLRPLMAVPDVEWVSLQVGPRENWAETLGLQLRPEVRDFGDTARVLTGLDLVITVDTAVANLALAMGVKTWVLPPTYPDFRWGLAGEPSRWYPAARLFRRAHSGDWAAALAGVAAALHDEARGVSPTAVRP